MKNFINSGKVMTFTAPGGGVTSGVALRIGRVVLVPVASVAAGALFDGETEGQFTLAKATGQAWTEGALLYWDNANARFTTVSTSNQLAGTVGTGGALSADATGPVRLQGIAAIDS